MLSEEGQRRDLRYATYISVIVFLLALQYWWTTTELLAFWLALGVSIPTFMISYVVIRLTRLIGRITGLNKPYKNAKGRMRAKVDEVIEEIDEEIEKEKTGGMPSGAAATGGGNGGKTDQGDSPAVESMNEGDADEVVEEIDNQEGTG
jgi:hypothetical protein